MTQISPRPPAALSALPTSAQVKKEKQQKLQNSDATLLFKKLSSTLTSPPASRDASPLRASSATTSRRASRDRGAAGPRHHGSSAPGPSSAVVRDKKGQLPGGAPHKRGSSTGQGSSNVEAERRKKTDEWQKDCIMDAKALWDDVKALGQGGKGMRGLRAIEFFGGTCRLAACLCPRCTSTSSSPALRWTNAMKHQGFEVFAVERLPRGRGKDTAAEDCPEGRLWVKDFLDVVPSKLPTVDVLHFS